MRLRIFSSQVIGFFSAIALLAVVFVVSCEQSDRLNYWRSIHTARQMETGADLFLQNCSSCHGKHGEGLGQLGPALNDAHFFNDRLKEVGWQGTLSEYIETTIRVGRVTATRPLYVGDGVMAMNAWAMENGGSLRPDQIHALTIFVLNWEATAQGEFTPEELILPTPKPASSATMIEKGQELFLQTGCKECHTVSGLSESPVGPDLSTVGLTAEQRVSGYSAEQYLRESFLIPNAYRVEGYPENILCGGVLTQSQLDDLVAFLISLR